MLMGSTHVQLRSVAELSKTKGLGGIWDTATSRRDNMVSLSVLFSGAGSEVGMAG